MALIERITVENDLIRLKFDITPRVQSLTNDKFTLTHGATIVEHPFKPIVLSKHYNSISRTLVLYFEQPLISEEVYTLTIGGIQNAAGSVQPTEAHMFRSGTWSPEEEQATPDIIVVEDNEPDVPYTPPEPTVPVEDHSVKNVFTDGDIISGMNPDFYVVSTDPADGSVFVEDDFDKGRITVTFSQRPNPIYLNSHYIKVQRKKLGGVNRWETVPIRISMDSYYPTIYIYINSQDATPVYNTTGSTYFVDGYKYRVKISKEVGV